MPRGTVKWFDARKGYGFITPEDGSRDIFVHATALDASNFEYDPMPGDVITYTVERSAKTGKDCAGQLRMEKKAAS